MRRNQQGFTAVEIIIALLVLLLLGLGGWYVWHKSSDKDSKAASSSEKKSADATPAEEVEGADLTDDWVEYSNAPGDYSFKHPASWVQAPHPELCTDGLALFGTNEASVGRCASESGGQMLFSSVAGDVRGDYAFTDGYTDATSEAATVQGVEGVKNSARVAPVEEDLIGGGYAEGTLLVRYIFYTGGRTYLMQYAAATDYPDSLVYFNLLVTHTFRFME